MRCFYLNVKTSGPPCGVKFLLVHLMVANKWGFCPGTFYKNEQKECKSGEREGYLLPLQTLNSFNKATPRQSVKKIRFDPQQINVPYQSEIPHVQPAL